MKKTIFADVLEAAGNLPLDAREDLVEILHKRSIEERRNKLAKEIKNARSEYKHNKCKAVSADDIMKEIIQ